MQKGKLVTKKKHLPSIGRRMK